MRTRTDKEFNRNLANYFAAKALYLDDLQRHQPNIRKLVEQPWQQTKGELWDEVTETLCGIEFLEAKCVAGMTFMLIDDYHFVLDNIPENQAEIELANIQNERIEQWIKESAEYSRKWSEYRDRIDLKGKSNQAKPKMPQFPPLCKIWSQDDIDKECNRIINNPSRLNRLSAFEIFISSQSYVILKYINNQGFFTQHACNFGAAGPVHGAAISIVKDQKNPFILRHWLDKNSYNPMPALIRTLTQTKEASSVRVTADGKFGIAAMGTALKIWDIHNGRCINTLAGHSFEITCLDITPDGLRAVSGGKDETVRVWDLKRGRCIYTFSGLGDYADNVCIAMDGKRAVVGSRMKKELRIWNLEDGRYLNALGGHTEIISHLFSTPDGRWLLSGSRDKTVRFWDLENNECKQILTGHTDSLSCTCMTPDANFAVSAGEDNTIRVWDLKSGNCIQTIEKTIENIQLLINRSVFNLDVSDSNYSKNYVKNICVSSDGLYAVATTESESKMKVWDLKSGLCVHTLEGHTDGVTHLVIMPDGYTVISCSKDNTIKVWDLLSAKCLQTLEGHLNRVNSVGATFDGKHIVSGSEDGTIRVWEWKSGKCLHVLEGHTDGISCVNLTPVDQRIVSLGKDQSMRIWDLKTGLCLRTIEGHTDSVTSVNLTPDGKYLLTGSFDDSVRLWNLDEGRCIQILKGFYTSRGINCTHVTSDGQYAIIGVQGSGKLQIWDLNSYERIKSLEIPRAELILGSQDLLCVSSNNQVVVSGYEDSKVRVWDLHEEKCLMTLVGHTGPIKCVNLTPDGRLAVSGGGYDRTLRVWDLDTGQCLRILEGHTGEVRGVDLTPDGRRVVSSGSDGTIRVWNIENGQCVRKSNYNIHGISNMINDGAFPLVISLEKDLQILDMDSGNCLRNLSGHTESITEVIMTPDGKRAISASLDNTIRIWDLESGKCLQRLVGHTDRIIKMILMSDGRHLASVSKDKLLKFWNLGNGKCIRTRNLPDYFLDYERGWGLTADGLFAIWIKKDEFWGWDIEKGTSYLLKGHSGLARNFSISPNGHQAVSSASIDLEALKLDLSMRVWNLESGQCTRVIEGHPSFFASKVIANGSMAISVCDDNKLRAWNLENGQCLQIIEGISYHTSDLYLTTDEKLVVSINPLSIWNLADRKLMAFYPAPSPIKSVIISPFSTFFIAKTVLGEDIILELITPERSTTHFEDEILSNTDKTRKRWWKLW